MKAAAESLVGLHTRVGRNDFIIKSPSFLQIYNYIAPMGSVSMM